MPRERAVGELSGYNGHNGSTLAEPTGHKATHSEDYLGLSPRMVVSLMACQIDFECGGSARCCGGEVVLACGDTDGGRPGGALAGVTTAGVVSLGAVGDTAMQGTLAFFNITHTAVTISESMAKRAR